MSAIFLESGQWLNWWMDYIHQPWVCFLLTGFYFSGELMAVVSGPTFEISMTEVWCIWSGHLWKQIHSRIQAMEVKQEEVVHLYHQDGRVTSVLWLTDPFSMWTQMMCSIAYGTRFSHWRVILWRKPAITLTCTLASTSFLSSFPNAFL